MKKTHKLLTYILTLCMLLTSFLALDVSKEPVQASSDREEIYVTTITVKDGVVTYDYDTYIYKMPCNGRFLVKYEFNKKCTPNFMVSHGGGILDAFPNSKNIKKGTRKSPIIERSDEVPAGVVALGKWSDKADADVLSDKTVSGTVKVYFIPTCTSLKIGTTAMELTEGSTSNLSVVAEPVKYAKNFSSVKWTSSKPAVAKVDKNGKVTAVAPGKATITAKVDNQTAKCTVTVRKRNDGTNYVSAARMELSKTEYNYTGKAKTPKVTVYDADGNVIPKSAYEVTYENNTNAGTATVKVQISQTTVEDQTIEGGFLSETFTIKPRKAAKVSLSKTSYNYTYKKNGFRPKVTVYDSKGKKISSKEYTVTYKNYCEGGTAKAIIQMNQNYGNKKFVKEYTIKYDAKTNELLPESKVLYRLKNKESVDTLYYTKQKDSVLKKMLPYGDVDISFGEIYNVIPYLNENAFWPGNRDYGYTGQYLRESYNSVNNGVKYDPKKFTGTISDLIQCIVHSPIKSVDGRSNDYYNVYNITCEDGSEYEVAYGNVAGMQYSAYSMLFITSRGIEDDQAFAEPYNHVGEYYAIIKVDKSKTPWGK